MLIGPDQEEQRLAQSPPRDPAMATRRRRVASRAAVVGALLGVIALIGCGFILLSRQNAPPSAPVTTEIHAPASKDLAGAASPNPVAAAPAAAPVWSIDKAASRLTFRASLGGQPVDGVFKDWDAQIAFDPKNLKASHAMIAVQTASALTGEPNRDELLPTPNWLSTRKFPKAALVTRSIVQTGPGKYEASADLKVRGLTHRVVAPFTLSVVHDVGRMQATITLDRTVFSIGEIPGMPLTALAPDVQLNLRLVARKGR